MRFVRNFSAAPRRALPGNSEPKTRAVPPHSYAASDTSAEATGGSAYRIYVGTYAAADSPGIHLYSLDPADGSLYERDHLQAGPNPSFLTFSPDGRTLYCVNQLSSPDGKSGGGLSAFSLLPESGKLKFLNSQPSHGAGPCHLTTDRTGRFLLVANYRSGTLALYPLARDGRIEPAVTVIQHEGSGPRPEQENAHAHYVAFSPDNRFALCCDLGIDTVLIYRFDAGGGTLTRHGQLVLASGAGPRHLDFSPAGPHVYLINELDSTLSVLAYSSESGTLTQLQTLSTLPGDYIGSNSCAEVFVHPSGKFVYGSNRGHDSIVIYRVEPENGCLNLVGHQPSGGRTPRSFMVDPSGSFLIAANQNSDSLASFRIDARTGDLTYLSTASIPKPVCLKAWPNTR